MTDEEKAQLAGVPSIVHERDVLRIRIEGLKRDLVAAEHRLGQALRRCDELELEVMSLRDALAERCP